MNKCDVCSKSFVHRGGLHKHERLKHGNKTQFEVKCTVCGLLVKNKSKLKVHVKLCHKMERNKRIKCSFIHCEEQFYRYTSLHEHLKNAHSCLLKEEVYNFQDENGFLEWKKHVEESFSTTYVLDTAAKKLKGKQERSYFICHRSYAARLQDKNTRSSKSSNKIGRACPSILTVTKCEGKFEVMFCSTHIGHQCELGRQKISNEDRCIIAGKLAEGVPVQRILEDVRETVTSDVTERIHLLEKKDIHNIKRDFSIGYATKRHENDAVSVTLWVEHMKEKSPGVILYYKEQGQEDPCFRTEDFVLIFMTEFQKHQLTTFGVDKICIDGTHGLNNYDFQLFTIMVVDDYGSGIPVAFCFSNRVDVELFKVYFKCIADQVGMINPRVFMTDDYPAFYNAWKSVMGDVSHQLLCSWHVNRNWMQNLNKIANKEKRSLVFKALQTLRNETDEGNFLTMLNTFLADLKHDADTISFGSYFEKQYLHRTEKWAYCFRKHLGINTNMYLESLHKTIKYHYLEGKRCKRLDKTINALVSLVRDKMFERLIKLSKGKVTEKVKKIQEAHRKSKSVIDTMITAKENEWLVSSSKNPEHKYVVQKVAELCISNCELRCNMCNICVHLFKCTCINNVVIFNICKHIHACVQRDVCRERSENVMEVKLGSTSKIMNLSQDVLNYQPSTSQFNASKQEIQHKLQLLMGLNNKVVLNASSTQYVNKHLDLAIQKMNKGYLEFPHNAECNVRGNVQPQLRLHSTKKSNRSSKHIENSAQNSESQAVREQLLHQKEVLHIHTGYDHTYTNLSNSKN